jgi:hypothetical protein
MSIEPLLPRWSVFGSEYALERESFHTCLVMVRYSRERGHVSWAMWWCRAMLEHRDNLRNLRRYGRVAPF